jgi:hypothetical protein
MEGESYTLTKTINGTYDKSKNILTMNIPIDTNFDYSNAVITLPSDLHDKIMNFKSQKPEIFYENDDSIGYYILPSDLKKCPKTDVIYNSDVINDLLKKPPTIKKATIMKVTKHPKFYSLKVRCPECNKISNNGTNRTKIQRQCNYCFNEYNIDMGSAFPDL